jgi:ABC-type Fe3+ transport system permease subunit
LIWGAEIARRCATESPRRKLRLGRIARLRDSGNLAWSVVAPVISLIAIAPMLAIGVLALQSSDAIALWISYRAYPLRQRFCHRACPNTIRFLAASLGAVEAGLSKMSRNTDAGARTLGATVSETSWRVHLPLLRPAPGAAALLVFVGSMKDLPATLLLGPSTSIPLPPRCSRSLHSKATRRLGCRR